MRSKKALTHLDNLWATTLHTYGETSLSMKTTGCHLKTWTISFIKFALVFCIHFALVFCIHFETRGSVVVSTSAWHAAGRRFDSRTRHVSLLGVKTWLSTGIVYHDSNVTWLPSRNKASFFIHVTKLFCSETRCSGVWQQLSHMTQSLHVVRLAVLLIWNTVRTFHDHVHSPLYRSHKQTPTKAIIDSLYVGQCSCKSIVHLYTTNVQIPVYHKLVVNHTSSQPSFDKPSVNATFRSTYIAIDCRVFKTPVSNCGLS